MNAKPIDNDGDPSALIALLHRPNYWIRSTELARALELVDERGNKSLIWHWKDADEWIRPEDTKLDVMDSDRPSHMVRFYSKRAAIICALRTRTPSAKAFKLWMTDLLVEALTEPTKQIRRDPEAFARSLTLEILRMLNGGDHAQ